MNFVATAVQAGEELAKHRSGNQTSALGEHSVGDDAPREDAGDVEEAVWLAASQDQSPVWASLVAALLWPPLLRHLLRAVEPGRTRGTN